MTHPTAMAPDASTSPVDWSRPVEAVHEDGRMVPVSLGRRDETMDSSIFVNGYRQRVHFDGKEDWAADWGGLHLIRAWRIRNVQPTTPERDPMRERLEALVWRMAERYNSGAGDYDSIGRDALPFLRDAHDMTADLPKPVDPDLIEAREIAASMLEVAQGGTHIEETRRGERDGYVHVCIAFAGIQRGRELAGEQA